MSIYEIAKITGYSPSTVARALRGDGYCSEEKRKEIERVVKEINYTPNRLAKELRQNVSKRILFGIPEMDNPYYFKMIQGVNSALEEAGYIMMIYNTKKELKKELEMISLLAQHYCDGIILCSFDFTEANISAIRKTKRPAVILNNYKDQKANDNFDCVYNGHTEGMEFATEHLIERGCRDIILLAGDLSTQTSRERAQGYFNVLEKHGIPIIKDRVLNGDYRKDVAYEAFKKYLTGRQKIDFTGIVAANDMMALGVIACCEEFNLRIPDDIKLVSFDNTDFSTLIKPNLSSIDLHEYDLGKKAGELLLERIEGRSYVSNFILTPTLYARQSSQI